MSTFAEQLCAVAEPVLRAGVLGATVSRRRQDAYAIEELPAIEVSRGEWSSEPYAQDIERATATVRLTFIVADVDPAETALDALHQAAHAVLLQSPDIAALGNRLRCTDTTEPEYAAGDPDSARMTATYQLQTLISAADLSRRFRSAP